MPIFPSWKQRCKKPLTRAGESAINSEMLYVASGEGPAGGVMFSCCLSPLSRREFLRAMAVGAVGLALPSPAFSESREGTARRLIERHAATPDDPWALVHGIRALGRDFGFKGERAVDYVLRTSVKEEEVKGRGYLHIPANVEVHTNMFLKTFLEAGVPLDQEVQVNGRSYSLKDLGEGAKALFRFDPKTFDRNDLAWSLIAFSELRAGEWENAYGQRIRLKELAAFGLKALQEATEGIKPYFQNSLPLPQKMPIHRFTCGGTHLLYSLLVAAKHGYLGAEGRDRLQEQLQMLIYRLQADPDLIDRYYQRLAQAPGMEVFRADAKLKLLGHALECLGYAKRNGLFRPGRMERERMGKAEQEVGGFFTYFGGLDLQAVRQRSAQLHQQIVGDICHAYRGMRLA